MTPFALAVTVHDPDKRLLAKFPSVIEKISKLYKIKTAACSVQTSKYTLQALKKNGFMIVFPKRKNAIGYSRTLSLKLALKNGNFDYIHYCDLDRLIHWQRFYPKELKKLTSINAGCDFTALGRIKKAWKTHPQIMVDSEKPANDAIRLALGLGKNCDFTSGSCLISKKAAEIITAFSTEPTNATDLEWPALIYKKLKIKPCFVATDGLSFETADYFEDEIKSAGSLKLWIKYTYGNPKVKLSRRKLTLDSISALERVLKN